MAEQDSQDAQDRTEQATPKRLEEARKRGDIPRSRDLSAAAVMMAGAVGVLLLGGVVGGGLHTMMRRALSVSPEQALQDGYLLSAFSQSATQALLACAPLFGMIVLAALLAPLALGGWAFSGESLVPNFSRLSPAAGFKRMFSSQSVVELIKSLAKFSVVAVAATLVLRSQTGELLSLGTEPTERAVMHAFSMCAQAFLVMTASLLVIAGFDVPYQLWSHAKRLRMSRDEIRREMKESEGSPEVRSKIRRMQQEMAQRRMMEAVPKADVVVTNPTHFAVALRYDENRMRAPIVVAKGRDAIAARIREIAAENKVPLFEAPPLARALYRNVELGGEIPAALYVAVAQVLTYIFQFRAAEKGLAIMPERPEVVVDEQVVGR